MSPRVVAGLVFGLAVFLLTFAVFLGAAVVADAAGDETGGIWLGRIALVAVLLGLICLVLLVFALSMDYLREQHDRNRRDHTNDLDRPDPLA